MYSITGNGSDELHAYILSQKKEYKLADYPTSLYGAALMPDGAVISTTQTSGGFRLGAYKTQWQPVNNSNTLTPLFVKISATPGNNASITSIAPAHYPTSAYHTWSNPLTFIAGNPTILIRCLHLPFMEKTF